MSKPIVAQGGGLADGALLVPFLTTTAGHDGGEDAGILEQQ